MTRKTLLLLAFVAVGGCVSHRGIASSQITPRTALKIHFATPQSLVFRAPGDTLSVPDVVELTGRMITLTADSITVSVSSAQRAEVGSQRFGEGTVTTAALADAGILEVQKHQGRTVALVLTLALGLALLIAIATYEEPPPPPPPAPKNK